MENDNKYTFANNLKRLMESRGRSRRDISDALGISYFTVSDWVNGKKYPRMDKVELLANYFGVLKSDLIEESTTNANDPPETITLSEGEEMLLGLFRQLPEEAQKMYLEVLRASLKNQSKDQ